MGGVFDGRQKLINRRLRSILGRNHGHFTRATGLARRGHAKTEIEAFFDLRPPAPPGLLTIQRRYFVRRKTSSRPQAKSLPCARGGGPQTGDGRVVICRSLTISQAELLRVLTLVSRPARRRNPNPPQADRFFSLFSLHPSLFSDPPPLALLPPLKWYNFMLE